MPPRFINKEKVRVPHSFSIENSIYEEFFLNCAFEGESSASNKIRNLIIEFNAKFKNKRVKNGEET